MLNQELVKAVQDLVKNGTQYNVDKLEEIYHEDLRIARCENDSKVNVINKEENIAFFRSKRDIGADPLSGDSRFLYAHASGPVGHVAVERKMKLEDKEEHLLYNVILRKVDGQWKVVSEFVIPLN